MQTIRVILTSQHGWILWALPWISFELVCKFKIHQIKLDCKLTGIVLLSAGSMLLKWEMATTSFNNIKGYRYQ